MLLVVGAVLIGRPGSKATSSDTTATTASTTDASTTTTTMAPERVVLGAAPLLGESTGLELWFESRSGSLDTLPAGVYLLDLDSAVLQRLAPVPGGDGRSTLVADGAGLHVFTNGGSPSVRIGRNGAVDATKQISGNVIAADSAGVWTLDYASGGRLVALVRKGLDGSTLQTLPLPSGTYPIADGDSGSFLLQSVDGRTFSFDGTTGIVTPLGTGVLAARAGTVLLVRCDDALRCVTYSKGSDGTERALDGPPGGPTTHLALSPDGSWAVSANQTSQTTEGRMSVAAENIASGKRVEIGVVEMNFDGRSVGTWSPDGRWFFLATSTGVQAWRADLETPIVIKLNNQPTEPYAIAVGPTVGSQW
jgi:hypothetical protein